MSQADLVKGWQMVVFRRWLVLVMLMFWQGGFMFYGAVVVPVGSNTQDSAQKDVMMFQGNWSLTSAQNDGKAIPEEEAKKLKLSIQGNKFVLRKEAVIISEGTFTLDPTKTPKQIDETITAGPSKGKVFLAIYEIDKDHHKVCFAAAGKERPKQFSSIPGSGHLLQVWKREKE
jgi:uncharacterized protein (TIGR03067 family)